MGITDLIKSVTDLVEFMLIPLSFSLCLLYFFWGVVKYIKDGATSDKAMEEAKKTMFWGVIALFVAFSIWGIVYFLRTELQLQDLNIEVTGGRIVN